MEADSWQNLPLRTVLYEWLAKNINLEAPSRCATIIGYIGIALIVWYLILWVARVILSIVWPLVLVATAVVLLRMIRDGESENLKEAILHYIELIARFVNARQFISFLYDLLRALFE
ncbi:uncharacterized protein LOC119668298 [Teleopsis dalmanni]|uniref:uncharacterized protein LOC119668138 n=1 Tax=Teleopsis dalmanni TaxID=139649 RepID=UPI0018CF0C75|nr:uncharacterized protein LOC119668138 [Teleopsis dalmanni]XP_037933687.1 uncharacterized protein LOC119668298 [Teleopsis dalmanni]